MTSHITSTRTEEKEADGDEVVATGGEEESRDNKAFYDGRARRAEIQIKHTEECRAVVVGVVLVVVVAAGSFRCSGGRSVILQSKATSQ